jgi:hypothetical protein
MVALGLTEIKTRQRYSARSKQDTILLRNLILLRSDVYGQLISLVR